ncbi:hypothetical protein D9M70_531900 [compost metagenome]
MQRQLVRLGNGRDRLDLRERIDRAAFRCLGQRDRCRLATVDIVERKAPDLGFEARGLHLAPRSIDRLQPGAVREEFRRAAFIGDDMRFAMAEGDAACAIGCRKCQRIGSRSGADEEDFDIPFEDFRELLLHLPVKLAGAIGGRISAGMRHQAFGNRGMGASPVVRRKNHHIPPCITVFSTDLADLSRVLGRINHGRRPKGQLETSLKPKGRKRRKAVIKL